MAKFKVGDRVVVNQSNIRDMEGEQGRVVSVVDIIDAIGVEFDFVKPWLHDCDGHGKKNQCRYFLDKNLEKVSDTKPIRRVIIEITDDGANAKYLYGKTIKKEARIRRAASDKPDDAKAAGYAVNALFGQSKADLSEEAEYASKTADILRSINWGDLLFRAYIGDVK